MNRTISPPKKDLSSLRQPLNEGEKRVLDFFDTHLSPDWEIYIQPHLNGLRPDFVLLNPNVGIAVFEVKDWDLNAIDRWVEDRPNNPPILKGRKNGQTFSLQKENPVEQVYRYKQEIMNLYCPRILGGAGFAVITAGIIFPSADDDQAIKLLTPCLSHRKMDEWPEYNPVSGQNALNRGDLLRVFPEASRTNSKIMSNNLAEDLRLWLVEPDATKTQREPIKLDEAQTVLANTRTNSGYRRITGPAGSGKSVVLAARAAQLVKEGKDVLVVTFNITLLNYLADVAVRGYPKARLAATWLHFHSWCRRICESTDNGDKYNLLWQNEDHFPEKDICTLVGSIIDADTEGVLQRYDAIIVDEGQDFKPSWWDLLRKVCNPGGEMLLAADATQDVYGTASSWTDGAMKGAGFAGNWKRLEVSYRIPSCLINHVREFGNQFLPKNNTDLPPTQQLELDLDPCKLRWIQVNNSPIHGIANQEVWNMLKQSGLSVSDLTILVDSETLGESIVALINESNTRCIDTFDKDKKQGRRKKLAFFMGDARIKVTTLHSFKGWESRALLICVGRVNDEKSKVLLYTGLTRLKHSPSGSFLTVVCGDPNLAEYGRSWPDFKWVEQNKINNNQHLTDLLSALV